jgi:hypothetical protein
MEIYRNETAQIKLTVPVTAVDGSFVVTATDGATVLYTFPSVAAVSGGYQVTLPFSLVDKDRKFSINWTFDYLEASVQKSYSAKTWVEVVTPYVTVDEIRDALGTMPPLTDAELKRVERRIRGVINNFTGQSFGRYIGAYRIQSTGDEALSLPARLIELTAIAGATYTDITRYGTRGDGWYLGAVDPIYIDGEYVSNGVITYPGCYRTAPWQDNVWYTVTGDWGYEDVPFNVKEAALILIEDNICPDSEYRDRYIDGVKTADYQYTYTPNAFRGTGSVIADQLLSDYIRPSLAVI